jgi:membrane-associated phospholipid phosphatase
VLPVIVVAFSRLYLDRHWLSDLAGGLTIGTAYLLLAIWVVEIVLVRSEEAVNERARRESGTPPTR